MIIKNSDWFGIFAFYEAGIANFSLLKTEPSIIAVAGKRYTSTSGLYLGDYSPIISKDGYIVGVKYGYINIDLDSSLLQSNLIQMSKNIIFRINHELSYELIWYWSDKDALEPNVNGDLMHTIIFNSSEKEWAICIPLDMFKYPLWCDGFSREVEIIS